MKNIRLIIYIIISSCLLSCSSDLMQSPNKNVCASLFINEGCLYYTVSFHGVPVINPSRLGIALGCDTLSEPISIKQVGKRIIDERYGTRGFHTEAINKAVEFTYEVSSPKICFLWQARIFEDGFAFRYILNENNFVKVSKELTTFTPPRQIPVWYFERPNHWKLKSYAGNWMSTMSDSLYSVSPTGPVQGPVLVYELPEKKYMAITEAALYDYSGMRLNAKSDASLEVNFTEGEDGFFIQGDGVTPWRVVLLADNLNELVNSDLITNLNPAPDSELFEDSSWIKPGRSVWSWWSNSEGYMTMDLEKHMIDCAQKLGYEYTLLDEGWEKWKDKWTDLKHICEYAHERNVGVFVWKHSDQLNIPADDYRIMSLFLDSVKSAGASGIKIDFMNGESKSLIDFDVKALQFSAKRQLMVDFHGCQQPSGEYRTYPNEITREGIRGLELNRMNEHLTGNHNVALVFTRCILNNADYTPIGFSNPGETSWAHQLATGFAFTSPLLVVAEHPDTLLMNEKITPMLPLLKAMPSVWDETIVLPESSISSMAILARRKGDDWYWIALNGGTSNAVKVNTGFLGRGTWKSYSIMDDMQDTRNVIKNEKEVASGEEWIIEMRQNGGAVIQFVREQEGI